jgi:hypothetical protein
LESIFLSYSFSKPEDRILVVEIEELLRSFGIKLETGLNLGGNQLTDEIKSLIRRADGLIALASRRDRLDSGDWHTHPWIRDEFTFAKASDKNAIALVEDGVTTNGAYESYERIPFNRDDPSPALLKLAKTLGIWKDKAGSRLKVRLLPDDIVDELESPSYKYQFVSRGDSLGWNEIDPVLEPGGIYLHLQGVRDDYLIQIEVSSRNGVRRSRATAQTMPITVE